MDVSKKQHQKTKRTKNFLNDTIMLDKYKSGVYSISVLYDTFT